MPYLKKDGKITTQVNATVPQELFKSCQRILEKRKMSVADFVREQYFANFSLPPILFNVFSPSFSLAGLSQHGDPFHHSHQCSSRPPDHESETIESKRAPMSNRERVLPPSPLPGTVRAPFSAYGSRISLPR